MYENRRKKAEGEGILGIWSCILHLMRICEADALVQAEFVIVTRELKIKRVNAKGIS